MTYQQPASAPVSAQDTPGGPGRQPDAPKPPQTAPGGFPDIQGRCPACGGASLFVGSGGYITCRRIECPEPDAASALLERNPRTTPDNPATSSDAADKSLREEYAAAIEADAERPRDERVGIINAVLAVRDREMQQLRAKVAEFDHIINWHTTCASCARILDSSYAETVRAETAEDALTRVRALHQPDPDGRSGYKPDDDDTPGAYGDIAQACRECGSSDLAVRWPCPTILALDPAAPQEPGEQP